MSANATDPIEALQNRGSVVLTITVTFLVASTVFVVLRLISRIGVVKKVTWDDHFIVLAWVLADTRPRVLRIVVLTLHRFLPLGFLFPSAGEHTSA